MIAMAATSFTRSFLRLFSGPTIWALHFLAIYGATGVLCARPALRQDWLGISAIAWMLGTAALLAVAAIELIHARDWRDRKTDFMRMTASGLALLSIIAIVWETVPLFLVPECG